MTHPDGPEALERILPVSRETRERLSLYVDLVRRWQPAQNLVAPSTLGSLWSRHVADSAQLQLLAGDVKRWIDFGSGAGFPGLVNAIFLADIPGAMVHMVESNQRKAAFLRTVIRETGAAGRVYPGRIETVTKDWSEPVEGVSARALAELGQLCGFAKPFVDAGARAFFHKGREYLGEIDKASHNWDLDLVKKESLVDPESVILVVSRIAARP